ncbi:PRKR-interacting protein 1 isoform X1 [Equus asinus]|uniref:PRKR-interacting protein 1 isoform X1 n=1 Tax=Equus asinus TaxID=9793 RepID=UPI0038F70958
MASFAASSVRPPRPKKEPQALVIPKNAAEEQKLKLERLMKNPDKAVPIPEKMSEWAPRPPPEFVRDVMGSSAGAGSGEFHVYRHLRRREYQRQDYMDAMAEKDPVSPRSSRPAALRRRLEQRRRRSPASSWDGDDVCHSGCLEPGTLCDHGFRKPSTRLRGGGCFSSVSLPRPRWVEAHGHPCWLLPVPVWAGLRACGTDDGLLDAQAHCQAAFINVPTGRGRCIALCPCFLCSRIWTVTSFGLVSVKGMFI